MPDENSAHLSVRSWTESLILDDLAIGVIEPRIKDARAHPFGRFAPTRHEIEEVLSVLGGPEHEGRGQEYG
jgi:hypothetical protein